MKGQCLEETPLPVKEFVSQWSQCRSSEGLRELSGHLSAVQCTEEALMSPDGNAEHRHRDQETKLGFQS